MKTLQYFNKSRKREANRRRSRFVAERLEARLALDADPIEASDSSESPHAASLVESTDSIRFFLSESGIGESPVVENPTIHMELGETKTLYLWMQVPDKVGLWGAGVTVVSTTSGLLSSASVSTYEPTPGHRWSMYLPNQEYETSNLGDFLGQPAGGTFSPRDLTSEFERWIDPSFDPTTGSLLFGTVVVHAESTGESEIFLEVGTGAIAPWRHDSTIFLDLPIHFGVGDEGVSGVDVGASGAVADAWIVVSGPTIDALPLDDNYQFVVHSNDVVDIPIASGVLANDDVPIGATAELVAGPKWGTVNLAADGSFSYVAADTRQRSGPLDVFTYRLVTADGVSRLARASIRLTPGLTAIDDYLTLDTRQEGRLELYGRLFENDRRYTQEFDSPVLEIVIPPANGTIPNANVGLAAYFPNPGFRGRDQFTYRISDGRTTSEATVYIDVLLENGRPIAKPDEIDAQTGTYLTEAILANDSDPNGDPLSVRIIVPPAHGRLTHNDYNANFTFTPGFAGLDSFTYVVSDGFEESEPVIVTMRVLPVGEDVIPIEPVAVPIDLPGDVVRIGFPVDLEIPIMVGFPFQPMIPINLFDYNVPRVHQQPQNDGVFLDAVLLGDGRAIENHLADFQVVVPAAVPVEPPPPAVAHRRPTNSRNAPLDAASADQLLAAADLSVGTRAERRAMRRGRRGA